MSRRKGFRALWKAQGELGRTALMAAGSLIKALCRESEAYCHNLITTYKRKKNEKKANAIGADCRGSHDSSGADRL